MNGETGENSLLFSPPLIHVKATEFYEPWMSWQDEALQNTIREEAQLSV